MKLKQWPWGTPQPGIYFDMPFPEYLGIRCLSNTAVKQLLVHHSKFWSNNWLNPRKKDRDSKALRDGRLYHTRILEGSEVFYNQYAEEYFDDPEDKDVIRNSVQLKAALRKVGEKVTFSHKGQGIERLMKAYPAAKILEVLKEKHRRANPKKELLEPNIIWDLEHAATAIEHNQYLRSWLKGGFPEVSVIWYDEELGVWFKCRFDYLKISACIDLKTIANQMERDYEKALDYELAGRKYIIQSTLYMRGAREAQKHILNGRIFGADKVSTRWLEAFVDKPIEEFRFIFQEKGDMIVTEGLIHSAKDRKTTSQGQARLEKASARFLDAYHHFGTDIPWVGMRKPRYIDYDSLPAFAGDL